jgi:hypothetical protein
MFSVETIQQHLGWCPNAPAMHTASTIFSTPPVTLNPLEPDGGGGGTGRIDRGIRIAAGSVKTLIRNKRLLWFSLLNGLVILFMFTAVFLLHVFGTYPCQPIAYPLWLTLIFIIQLIVVFCIYFLLAGLVLSVSSGLTGRVGTLREGLAGARSHTWSLFSWSVVMALLGTALYVIQIQSSGTLSFTVARIIDQFPFNFILLPEIYSTGPIGGSYHLLSAITFTIIATMINAILFIFSLFVVPGLVLENKRVPGSVAGSIPLVKKSWGEMIVCFLLFGLAISVAALLSLLFRGVYGVIAPHMLLFWYPGDVWIAGAVLYMLAFSALTFIGSTIAGIATLNLYTYAKTGRMLRIPERNRNDTDPVQ